MYQFESASNKVSSGFISAATHLYGICYAVRLFPETIHAWILNKMTGRTLDKSLSPMRHLRVVVPQASKNVLILCQVVQSHPVVIDPQRNISLMLLAVIYLIGL